MSYIELINEFWLKDEEYSYNGSETRLYFYLLKQANTKHWKVNPLSFADGDIMHGVRITANTLKEARNRLATTGLIKLDVKKANQKGRKSKEDKKCKYLLIGAELSKIDNLSHKSTHNFTDNSAHNSSTSTPYSNKEDNRLKIKDKKVVKKTTFTPPTLEEIEAYFFELTGNGKADAKKFEVHYSLTNWTYGKSKTPLKNWRKAVEGWIARSKDWHQEKLNSKPSLEATKQSLINSTLENIQALENGTFDNEIF